MKTLYHILLSGIFCLIVSHKIHAQDQSALLMRSDAISPSVQSLTVENGLPQGLVTGIVQDRQGFLWMGTKGGLVRYDGYQVKVFKNDPTDSTTLASNVIQYLYLDRENNLWIIYANHLVDIFNPITHSVKHIAAESELGWLLEATYLQPADLFEDSRGRYWVVSPDLRRLHYFTWQHPSPVPVFLPEGEKIIAIQEDQKGKVWVCTSKTLYTISDDGSRLNKIADLPKRIRYNDYLISKMIQDKQGNWIIGNTGCVLIFTHDHEWQVVATPFPEKVTHFVVKAPDGKIYLDAGNQVFKLNHDHSLSLIWTNTNTPGDLRALMVDRSNVLWAGTDTFGARFLNLSSRGFHSYRYHYGFIVDVLNSLHFLIAEIPYGENITSSYFSRYATDQQGNLWFINIDRADRPKPVPPGYLPVFKLANQKASVLPIKTNSPGWKQITFDDQNRCWAILLDEDTVHCSLAKVNLAAGTVSHVLSLDYLFNQTAYLTAFHHKICLVYNHALQLYDPQTKESTIYRSKDFFGNAALLMALPGPRNDSVLWITSIGNGLIRFNVVSGKVKAFTEKNDIPNNTVYAAIADKSGNLWCSSNKGIFRFNPTNHHVLSFTKKDGLQGNEFNRYHFLHTPDGKIFFGGTHGWTAFYPDSIRIDSFNPPTVITGIQVNNKPFTQFPKWKDSVITTMSSLTLPHDQNFLAFSFAGLEFNDVGQLSYRYQLEGIDKEWVNAGTENTAHYTNLSPGDYTFRVNAGNTAGIWSHSISTMKIVILPPWWKTWWAYLIYEAFILGVIYLFYRYRINRLHLQHQVILQQKEAEQLREMDEMKSRFFSNITHEFRTPLSLIIAPLELLHKEITAHAARKRLSGVQHHAMRLLQLVNQLLDMSKLESGSMKIDRSRGRLHEFISDIVLPFKRQTALKNIQLLITNPVGERSRTTVGERSRTTVGERSRTTVGERSRTTVGERGRTKGEYIFDADKWQKIISNLLSNAIKFTPEGGKIQVTLSTETKDEVHDLISLSVSDTGIGISADKQPHIFDRFYQADNSGKRNYEGTGIGLALTKELTELMQGEIEVKSESGAGTTFHVSIPLEKAGSDPAPQWSKKVSLISGLPIDEINPVHTIEQDQSKPTILIVEDNRSLNVFIAEILQQEYRIISALNGEEGLKAAQGFLPDLIISDVMMPVKDGYTFCKEIKSHIDTSHIAVVLLTAKISHDSMIEGLGCGADDYISKPFHVEEMRLRIHNIIERQRILRNYFSRQFTSPEEHLDTQAVSNPFLKQLYEVIEKSIDDETLDVGMLAKKMFVSRSTLNRKLAVLLGLSANETIRICRLKKAARLLRLDYSVAETAYNTGFRSASYFSTAFKEFYGLAPSEYEKSERTAE